MIVVKEMEYKTSTLQDIEEMVREYLLVTPDIDFDYIISIILLGMSESNTYVSVKRDDVPTGVCYYPIEDVLVLRQRDIVDHYVYHSHISGEAYSYTFYTTGVLLDIHNEVDKFMGELTSRTFTHAHLYSHDVVEEDDHESIAKRLMSYILKR